MRIIIRALKTGENVLDIKNINLPTVLTLIRLGCSPLFLPFIIFYLLPYNIFWVNCVIASVVGALCMTDFFDGYLARTLKQETKIGGILDPIADKFLLYATLVALLAIQKIYFYWVILFIGREFFMMGLRQVALEHNFSVKVSFLAKIKATLQMIMIVFIIINPYQYYGLQGAPGWNGIELLLIGLTLFLTLISAQRYYRSFIHVMNDKIYMVDKTLR